MRCADRRTAFHTRPARRDACLPDPNQEAAMRNCIRLICLLLLVVSLVACGNTTHASLRTPVVIVQTAPPLPTATTQPTEPPMAPPTKTAVPTALPQLRVDRAVNLRAGPSTDFAIIRTLDADTLVE